MEAFDIYQENYQDLDNYIIKDKDYYAKRRKKCLLIGIPILLVIITITIVLVIVLLPLTYNEVTCQYETKKENENIHLININNNIKFKIRINDISHDNKNSLSLKKAGIHTITFEFENKLDSLEGFFEGNKYLIEADFSKLQTENIKSMENLFKDCSNLIKVNLDIKTPNLENIKNMFYDCD